MENSSPYKSKEKNIYKKKQRKSEKSTTSQYKLYDKHLQKKKKK